MSFDFSLIIPLYAWHWTTIIHYAILLIAMALVLLSGEQGGLFFSILMLVLGVLTGIDLYLNYLPTLPRIGVFFVRLGIFVIPIVLAGSAQEEGLRGAGILLAGLGLPLFALVFFTCVLGPLGDPRIAIWC